MIAEEVVCGGGGRSATHIEHVDDLLYRERSPSLLPSVGARERPLILSIKPSLEERATRERAEGVRAQVGCYSIG